MEGGGKREDNGEEEVVNKGEKKVMEGEEVEEVRE